MGCAATSPQQRACAIGANRAEVAALADCTSEAAVAAAALAGRSGAAAVGPASAAPETHGCPCETGKRRTGGTAPVAWPRLGPRGAASLPRTATACAAAAPGAACSPPQAAPTSIGWALPCTSFASSTSPAVGAVASLQRVDASQESGKIWRRLRGMVPPRARHDLAVPSRGRLCGVVSAEDARRLGQSDKHPRRRTAAALPAVPGGFQGALRRGGAPADGPGTGPEATGERGRDVVGREIATALSWARAHLVGADRRGVRDVARRSGESRPTAPRAAPRDATSTDGRQARHSGAVSANQNRPLAEIRAL
jgi:hypothetical protein